MSEDSPDLAPTTLWQSAELRLTQSSSGFALFFHDVLVFKSWSDFPDAESAPTDALLFLRNGVLVLRNARGEVMNPEPSLSNDQRKLLAEIFSIELPKS